jgi:hypothetical protein
MLQNPGRARTPDFRGSEGCAQVSGVSITKCFRLNARKPAALSVQGGMRFEPRAPVAVDEMKKAKAVRCVPTFRSRCPAFALKPDYEFVS